jgi:hypothetical protein
MFDRYQINSAPSHTSVSVTEKRAPTEESVRLLREMEARAKDEVLQTIRLESNTFKGVLHKMEDYINGQTVYRVVFDFNGKRVTVTEPIEYWETLETFVPRLRDLIAKELATLMVIAVAPSQA